jgi:predicted ATPase/DNA-binding SARP family transcriptional activator
MLPGDVAELRVQTRRRSRLPVPLSRFVGRDRELATVAEALSDARLVCLTGPGGVGKTRLAIAVAQRVAERFDDGVWWVDLGPVAPHGSVVRALASAFGVHEVGGRTLFDSIVAVLAERDCLVVFDNCEHVLPACGQAVRRLLVECERVRVLVTSREALAVPGATGVAVPPLDDGAAAQLFCARAASVQPGFAADESNTAAIERICRGLDGLPLALELAAARVRVRNVAEIADALEDRLAMLVATDPAAVDRHRTMRAALDWSYRLLPEPERLLLAELSVFRGGFSLDAAGAVHVGDPDEPTVLELVARLIDRSLVTRRAQPGPTRYELLETVRLYAAEHLERGEPAADVARRHAQYYVGFAETAEPELSAGSQREWLDLVEADRGNIAASLRWAVSADGDVVAGLRICAALWRFCYLRGYYSEGRRWAAETLAVAADAPAKLRARALLAAGNLAHLQCDYSEAVGRSTEALEAYRAIRADDGVAAALQALGSVARERADYARSRELHEQSLALWRGRDDSEGMARSLNYLSMLAWLQADVEGAVVLAHQAADRFRSIGDGEGVAWALLNLGAAALYAGRGGQADTLLRESLARSRAVGYREGEAWSRELLGLLAADEGAWERGAQLLRESLRTHWALGDRWRSASVLEALAGVVADNAEAARLLGAAAALRDEIGAPRPPVEQARVRRVRAALAETLGGEVLAGAETVGRLASVAAVVESALSAAPAAEAPPAVRGPRPLERATPAAASLVVTAFGYLSLRLGEREISAAEFGYAKPRELLCFLLDRGESTKEQIGLALWPSASSSRLRSSFHTTLHHLRAALDSSDRIEFVRGKYRFNHALPYEYDVETYESLLARAREAEYAEPVLAEAVRLYQGDYLADVTDAEWIDERRAQLRRSFGRALLSLARLQLAAGRYGEAIEVLHRAVEQDPLRESVHRELLRCYAASGDRALAMRHFHELVELLRAELGTPPAPETVELYQRIRRATPV